MLPEMRGYRPEEVVSAQGEIRENEKNFETELAEVMEVERQLARDVHRVIAERAAREKTNKVPAWARKAFALAYLASVETAEAKDLHEQSPQTHAVAELIDRSIDLPSLKPVQQEMMERYLADEESALPKVDVSIRLARHADRDTAPGVEIFNLDNPAVEDFIKQGEGIVFDGFVSEVVLTQKISFNEIPDALKETWNTRPSQDFFFASMTYKDTFNNTVETIIQVNGSDTTHAVRQDYIYPAVEFQADNSEPLRLAFDLSLSGGVDETFANTVYHKPVRPELKLRHVPFSQFDAEDRTVQDLTKDQMRAIERGLSTAQKLFHTSEPLKGLYLRDDGEMNAFAFGNGLIELRTGLTMESADQPKILEEVVEHEVYHQMDFTYDLSSNKELQDIWLAAGEDVLREFDEERFSGGFGGHSWENVQEFVASFLNGLDSESWLANVESMSPEGRLAYRMTLKVIAEQLSKSETLSARAGIHKLLQERMVEFDTHFVR